MKLFKNMIGLAAAATTLICLSAPAFAAQVVSNTISVTGSSSIMVVPDSASVRLGVETRNVDSATAQNENAQVMENVMASVKAQGIADSDIKTTGYYIYPQYRYEQDTNEGILSGYVVENSITVTVRNIANISKVIDDAASAGANVTSSIEFFIDDRKPYYNQCLKGALSDAKAKAEALADGMGVTLGAKPIQVMESGVASNYAVYAVAESSMMDGGGSAKRSTPIAPGEMEVSAQITVIYGY